MPELCRREGSQLIGTCVRQGRVYGRGLRISNRDVGRGDVGQSGVPESERVSCVDKQDVEGRLTRGFASRLASTDLAGVCFSVLFLLRTAICLDSATPDLVLEWCPG